MFNMEPEYVKKFRELQNGTVQRQAQEAQVAAKKDAEQKKSQGLNPDGSPKEIKFDSMLGKDGMIDKKYQIGGFAKGLMADDLGYNKFESEALREGPSAYANLLLQQQELERQDNLGDINSQYNMASQNAMDQMASQGGLYGGAKERMGANSIRDLLAARQGARRDNQQNVLGIQAQDEQNRIGQLQQLTGMEMDRNQMGLSAKEFDLGNSMNEMGQKRNFEKDMWNTKMQTWASNKAADAQAKAAGGGCFPQGTMIEMLDGTHKRIDQINLGDEVVGGIVSKLIKGLGEGATWYNYEGVIVTGSHAVYENDKWIRVKDSEYSELMEIDFAVLYNLSTSEHILSIEGKLFSDFDEVDESGLSDIENLKIKNEA